MRNIYKIMLAVCVAMATGIVAFGAPPLQPLKVSANGRHFMTADGKPFFWLGDTGWLLFSKLKREEAVKYLDDRKQKGFNVIQVMVLHTTGVVNAYGDTALQNRNVATPNMSAGYWDHVDYIIDAAAERGIYMAMVPVWGSEVKAGHVNREQAKQYATFLANRYKNKSNIVWMNGGDIKGTDSTEVWNVIGSTLRAQDPHHLITFHPRGRWSSSTWFHAAPWLDFNMFQSGHRRYDQDTSAGDHHYGEDNWKYIDVDYSLKPVKPTLDAEPSYENIPQGLHDPKEGLWNDNDVRRYAYWSVFAGGCGFTYGDNAVMQMHRPGDTDGNYGVKQFWYDAIDDPGSGQMQFLKKLILSKPGYFDRVPDQSLIVGEVGNKYGRLIATRGRHYAMVYTYTGRNIKINMDQLKGKKGKLSWYNPRNGEYSSAGDYKTSGIMEFNPPGEPRPGNDWVLVIEWTSK